MSGRWCLCTDAFRQGELTPKNIDVLECSRLQPAVAAQDSDLTRSLRYHASIPLYFQDRPLGIMNLTSPMWRKLGRKELQLLSTIVNQVGIAIERARLVDESTTLARAEERARIERELHYTLAQGLTATALQIEGALYHLEEDSERARERLLRALDLSRTSLEEVRRSVMDLRTTPLAEALGAGSGLLNAPLPATIARIVRGQVLPSALSINSMSFFLGGGFGTAALMAVVTSRGEGGLSSFNPLHSGSAAAYSDAFLVLAIPVVVTMALSLTLPATAEQAVAERPAVRRPEPVVSRNWVPNCSVPWAPECE